MASAGGTLSAVRSAEPGEQPAHVQQPRVMMSGELHDTSF